MLLLALAEAGSKRGRLGLLAEDCRHGHMGQHSAPCHRGGCSTKIGGGTCWHSGHSKSFICSQAAFVRPMHFGWYLRNHTTGSLMMTSSSGKQPVALLRAPHHSSQRPHMTMNASGLYGNSQTQYLHSESTAQSLHGSQIPSISAMGSGLTQALCPVGTRAWLAARGQGLNIYGLIITSKHI